MWTLQRSKTCSASGEALSPFPQEKAIFGINPYQWLWCQPRRTLKPRLNGRPFGFSGQDALAVRASKKLRNDDSIVPVFAGTSLKDYLDRVPLWRGNHVSIKQLTEDFGRYLYLPRLKDTTVLLDAIKEGVGVLTWVNDSFAYADSFDEASNRYRGLRGGQNINLSEGNLNGLLVKPDIAHADFAPKCRGIYQ
jgi:hypothetical protein